jgi:hypothetical protein
MPVHLTRSHRCSPARFQRQVPALARDFAQDHPSLPASISLSASPQARRAVAFRDVARATGPSVAAHGRTARLCRLASPFIRAARADARVGTANSCVRHPGGPGTELARSRGEIIKSGHGRPTVARSRRLSRHVHEGVYAHQFEIVEREANDLSPFCLKEVPILTRWPTHYS